MIAWSLKTLLGQCDNERERSLVRDAYESGRASVLHPERVPDREECGDVYEGPSYPEYHGVKCTLPKSHVDRQFMAWKKHEGTTPDGPVHWFDKEQKAKLFKEKR